MPSFDYCAEYIERIRADLLNAMAQILDADKQTHIMESVKVDLTEKLKDLFDQGESLGAITFVYNVEVSGYEGQLTVPNDHAMMWTVPVFLKDVPAEHIHIQLIQDADGEKNALFFIQIQYAKDRNDPQEFDMEIKCSPASTFYDLNQLNPLHAVSETAPETEPLPDP